MLQPIDYSISKFATFAGPDVLSDMRRLGRRVPYRKGQQIETRGDPANSFHLIENGLIQLGLDSSDGSRLNITRLGAGHTFGETAFYLNQTVVLNARAKTDAVLLRLNRKAVDQLMDESVDFSKALIAVACMRLQTTLSHIGDSLDLPIKSRVAKQILSVSESAGGANCVTLRQIDLAHSLGVSRVSIGKAIKSLSSENIIVNKYGRIEITNRNDLIQLVNSHRSPL